MFFSSLDCQVRNDLFHWGPRYSYNIKKRGLLRGVGIAEVEYIDVDVLYSVL